MGKSVRGRSEVYASTKSSVKKMLASNAQQLFLQKTGKEVRLDENPQTTELSWSSLQRSILRMTMNQRCYDKRWIDLQHGK